MLYAKELHLMTRLKQSKCESKQKVESADYNFNRVMKLF